MLLTWCAQDPVSQREIDRNNAIYARQNNRNPYIDHPEYVQLVWNPAPDTEVPTAATNLTIASFTDTTITLNWTAGTDNVAVTSYDIYVDGIKKTAVSGTTATISGLTPSTNYSFYVISKDAAVNGSLPSNTVNGSTGVYVPDTQAPTAPTNLVSTNTTSTKVSLSWTASTDNKSITSYDVYVNGSLNTSVSGIVGTVIGLTPSTIYSFYVIARDAAGNSSIASNTINETTKAAGTDSVFCANESFEKIPSNGSSYSSFTWTGDSDIDWTATDARTDQKLNTTKAICIREGSLTASISSYGIGSFTVTTQQVFNGASGTFNLRVNGNIVGTIPYSPTATTTTISNINITDDVIISITDNSNLGASTKSRVIFDDLSWTCYSGLGVDRLSKNEFKIYPNPSHGNFNVMFNESDANHSVEVISLLGQKVFEKNNVQSDTISVTNLQKGTYLIKISKGLKSRTEKIVIN
jgi:chitodextrinase